jgi:hypothetical protein
MTWTELTRRQHAREGDKYASEDTLQTPCILNGITPMSGLRCHLDQ